jgi:hypothetical protein
LKFLSVPAGESLPVLWLSDLDSEIGGWRVWGQIGVVLADGRRLSAKERTLLIAEFEQLVRQNTFAAVGFCNPSSAFATETWLADLTSNLTKKDRPRAAAVLSHG